MNYTVQKGDWKALEIFIKKRVLEITCGEAPFLTTRYDPVTGEEYNVYEEGYVECATS